MVVKFYVWLFYINTVTGLISDYCTICANHTLCKYKIPGPSGNCIGYNPRALLSEDDIKIIVNRINEKRNFVAMHHYKYLPGAANMRKIVWSQELAEIAQRWVDQCDSSLRPDRNDECRDLENITVGQNIATVTGFSPGIHINSFVDMWFMQLLEYTGSVSFYNQSTDFKTNLFTQLIWAETNQVGCGKARFFTKHYRTVLVDRLICNFAPQGNLHGKPVYIIGYAATQCSGDTTPDYKFSGLCSMKNKPVASTTTNALTTSLLRILNPSDGSVKYKIDPLHQNAKQTKNNEINISLKKKSYAAIKRSHPLENDNFWSVNKNFSIHYGDHQQQERGHSRVYHGHNHRNEFDSIHTEATQNWRRYDTTSSSPQFLSQGYRKHYDDKKCTRKQDFPNDNYGISECKVCKERTKQCTRGQKSNCDSATQAYQGDYFCPCRTQRPKCFSNTKQCNSNTNCNCVMENCLTTYCPNIQKRVGDNSDRIKSRAHNYGLLPKLSLRNSGKIKQKQSHSEEELADDLWLPDKINDKHITLDKKDYDQSYSERRKRETEEGVKFKPFWQMDEFANKKLLGLKSLRYTTLSNKKSKKSRPMSKSSKTSKPTEFITLQNKVKQSSGKPITEKYLSFDELMHLRKFSTTEPNARRYDDIENIDSGVLRQKDTTVSVSTTEYTANTPFIRMKHCTRKLTCTWTAAALTDSSGNLIPIGPGGPGGNRGSNTPPGYVEGCTRTSTCTRDYMHRNKMDTLPTETTFADVSGDDEDYCERRTLNRRNLDKQILNTNNENNITNHNKTHNHQNNKLTYIQQYILKKLYEKCYCLHEHYKNYSFNPSRERFTLLPQHPNISRKKRSQDYLSYGDLYYYVLQKIVDPWKNKRKISPKKCMCNYSQRSIHSIYLLISLLYTHVL